MAGDKSVKTFHRGCPSYVSRKLCLCDLAALAGNNLSSALWTRASVKLNINGFSPC